jgi:Cdc6-like AAA superfamily ATPase
MGISGKGYLLKGKTMKNIKNFQKPDIEDVFADNIDNINIVAAMAGVMTTQQGIAVDLTKLVLEHCVKDKITKDEVFEIYTEACDLLREQIGE